MSLNIKNEETHRMAQELAALTGESMTAAVTEAVRERLTRVKSKGLAHRIMNIAKRSAPLWKEPYKSIDHGDFLYDEKGLPK
jgi:antitoxin VapB